jgi:hypothetical protein
MGDMVGRVLADDVDDAGIRFLGVVQVGEPVGEAGPQVQQGRRRSPEHAAIAVGRARHHAFEQAEHAAHAWNLVEGGNEMHLRGTRIGETNVHVPCKQGAHQAFRSIHLTGHQGTVLHLRIERRLPQLGILQAGGG